MEYVSTLRGFTSALGAYYNGPAGALAGTPSGFQAAALFLMNDVVVPVQQTLWGNQDTVLGHGWSLAVRPSVVVGAPPNAIDVVARVAGATRVATLLNAYPGVPILAHMIAAQSGADVLAGLYINGVQADQSVTNTVTIVPSTGHPSVGMLFNGGLLEPCVQAQILGTMYHEGASPAGVSPASFYVACREAGTLVAGADNDAASTWQNQYSVQRGLASAGITPVGANGPQPPAIWTPDVGNVPLTRAGNTLTVRAYKNLDWNAALFATLDVP